MNRNKLKTYAPQARRDFIQAVTDRAAQFGLSAAKIEPMTEKGDVVLISGKPFPKSVGEKRKKLEARIKKDGFEQTIEAMAYTWFNRLVAIRFMELHGYLDHGFRVLSHPAGHSQPEILEHAQHVELAGLDQKQVVTLKLDGNKEEELYRLLLLAQCNALHKALPFLFESLDDETELLLPDNLLHSDSLIRKLVGEIEEEDWKEVEIIGWLYQFYITEKKDEVIGKVVASEDIPAATQLFTPNWIVKYLVQNTIGRQWLATYPESSLRQKMEYYIEPAEQTPEVQEQLRAITPTSLNPTELTLLDPACGSGHILVEAYDLFKSIYEERGFRAKDIPALILEKNLFGLEIDDRAAQLAAFALMMKARADDRRIFESEAKPNIVAIRESADANATEIYFALTSPLKGELTEETMVATSDQLFETEDNLFTRVAGTKTKQVAVSFSQADIASLVELFENGKTFGSLIKIPPNLAAKLPEITKRLDEVLKAGDLTHAQAHVLSPLLRQATMLARHYDAVVANPPYMGTRYFSLSLKQFVDATYPDAKVDLYACFIHRNQLLAKHHGHIGMITIPNWMFLSSFESLRVSMLDVCTIDSLIHNGRGVFGSDFGSCSFVFINHFLPSLHGVYRRLFEKAGSVATNDELDSRFSEGTNHLACTNDFLKIPGRLVAYWLSKAECNAFASNIPLHQFAPPRQGLATTDDGRFIRLWPEVSCDNTLLNAPNAEVARVSKKKWFPLNKGGPFRRWYGNLIHVINWYNDGEELKKLIRERYGSPSKRIYNEQYYFREGITYSNISIAEPSFRFLPTGCIFSSVGQSIYSESHIIELLGYLNSRVASRFLEVLSPTIKFEAGQIANLPFKRTVVDISECVRQLVTLFREDWNSNELSWEFASSPLVNFTVGKGTISSCFEAYLASCSLRLNLAKVLEERINSTFIDLFDLNDSLSPVVDDAQVGLGRADRLEDIKRLVSFAIGCMMGRYSLEKPGLILASQGENLDSFLLKVSSRTELLPKDPVVREFDRIVLAKPKVKCFGCGAISSIEEAKFVIAGETNEKGQLHGRPFIYCTQCCDHDRASYVTMSMPLSQFSPKTAIEQKWCEPETLQIFLNLADCFGKRIPLRPEEVKFLPDEDGIIPLMEYSWFPDDAANRFEKFIATAWPAEHLEENLDFVADSLGTKKGETAQETIRRYLASDFYKHHLSMYKKRPIYWLFSSGKQRGFQALVYLHRYNEGTLARMRTEYVVPLIGKMTARISQLGDEIEATSASPRKKKLTTDKATITKQLAEVQAFEEKLRHYADQRIKLDLDDGVKVNYGKFGDLLADVKAICGTKDEE